MQEIRDKIDEAVTALLLAKGNLHAHPIDAELLLEEAQDMVTEAHEYVSRLAREEEAVLANGI